MKISITFKTPDVVDYAVEDIVDEEKDNVKNLLSKWIEYGEYVTIDFDLNDMSAKVRVVNISI